jgi:hypothetical protein
MRPALLLLLLAVPHVAAAAWTITPYDPTPNGGASPSLRIGPGPFVDGSGLPQIAYWSGGSGFHYYDGVSSQSVNPSLAIGGPPDQVQLIRFGEDALALDNGGQPWIAEANIDLDHSQNNTLTIAHRANGVWTFEPLGGTEGLLSIEYDGLTGKVHLLHMTSAGMVYAWRESGTWHTEPFGPSGTLRLDHAGNPAIAYCDASGLHYATRVGNAWQSVLVEARTGVGVPALAFNGLGRPRIVYGYWVGMNPGDYFMRYATETDGTWTTEPVAAAGGSVYDYDLAMLGDVPYIALQSGSSGFFVTKGAGGWTAELIDPETYFGQTPSIAIDADYRPIIAYQAASYGARYATGSQVLAVSPASSKPSMRPGVRSGSPGAFPLWRDRTWCLGPRPRSPVSLSCAS